MAAGKCIISKRVAMLVSFLTLIILAGNVVFGSVLITGGGGFIGYHTSLKLVEAGTKVIVLDNFNNEYEPNIKKTRANKLKEKGVTVLEGSSSDIHIIEYIFRHYNDITGIVHAAAYTSIQGNKDDPLRGVTDNIESLVTVLDVLVKNENPQVTVVYLSSSDVYSSTNSLPFDVSSKLPLPTHIIGAMKMSGESLLSGYSVSKNLKAISLRLSTVYGPWDRPGNIVYDIANKIQNNEPVELPYKGDTPLTRDLIYIDDVVQGIMNALKYKESGHKIFNIGNGVGVPLTNVIDVLKKELGKDNVKITKTEISSDTLLQSYSDISTTKTQLNWAPQTSLQDGMTKFIEWFKSKQFGGGGNFDAVQGKAFNEFIDVKNKEFVKRIGDLREKYTEYAKAHNIPVAKFYRNKNFLFFKGVDSGRGRRRVGGSVQDMKNYCNLVDECVAFNAHGDMKGVIDIQSKWGHGPGLYVADIDVCQAGLHNCFGNSTCTYKGPAQFECGCQEGFGWINGHCVELYVEGRVSQAEADEKLADYIDGRDWKTYVGDKANNYIEFHNKDENNSPLLYYPSAKGNVEKLKDACSKTYHCLGFSTNGLLKRGIDQPRGWRGSGESMYLLDVDYCSLDAFRCSPNSRCRRESAAKYSC